MRKPHPQRAVFMQSDDLFGRFFGVAINQSLFAMARFNPAEPKLRSDAG